MTYSHMGTPTLPSALSRFTTEFGMGSGGTNSLCSSGKLFAALSTVFDLISDLQQSLQRMLKK
jgi:hypothetical protein